jgi:hypothetical protein
VKAKKKVRRKRFLTQYKNGKSFYAWSIYAKDWKEAKHICKLINHKLLGLSATKRQIKAAERAIELR